MNVNLLVGWLVGCHNNLLHKYIKVIHKTARQNEYRMNNLTNIGRVSVRQRLINQSFYHKILLLQKFIDRRGMVLKQ